jgi:uncharacterized damage-inducible protein DinB
MMRKLIFTLCFVAVPLSASAQTSDGGFGEIASTSMASVAKSMHNIIRRNLVEAAEKMPVADFAFKPTPDVRSFGQLVGHLANGNFYFCAQVKGEASPSKENFERATDRDAILKGLRDSLAYCDTAYNETTDANFNQAMKVAAPGGVNAQASRGSVLVFNTAHNNEHYGNIIVYLRLKGIVPPSTARVQKK